MNKTKNEKRNMYTHEFTGEPKESEESMNKGSLVNNVRPSLDTQLQTFENDVKKAYAYIGKDDIYIKN
jgi:hypothetical protein